ncbi:MAG: GNAT family N-acetyltransferase [Terriglobia bacterium]
MLIETNPLLDDEVQELLEELPCKPYSQCPGILPLAQARYAFRSLQAAQQSGATLYVAREGGRTRALLQTESLEWDSQVLGFSVARISRWIGWPDGASSLPYRAELLRTVIANLHRRGIRYLLARVPATDVPGAQLLEENHFQLVDGLLTFGTSPQPVSEPVNSNGFRCGAFQADDLAALKKIAAGFSLDRFHADPVTKERADRVHQKWIEDSCAGAADCVLVARNGGPAGFTTLKLDRLSQEVLGIRIGTIVLVATAPTERRKGVARMLTRAALDWFRSRECSWVEVGTQVANLPAAHVYQSAGFVLTGSSMTFRLLL